jgi:membrane-bound lytic murein transglycosylase B
MWGALVALAVAGATFASPPAVLPPQRSQLIADLDVAQQLIDGGSSSLAELESAGRFEQLAVVALAHEPARVQRAILKGISRAAAASIGADLAAARALGRLAEPPRPLPPWRIVAPPPPATLLGYFRQAQARFGVRWQYLAAIEFIETKFGRVVGLSSAGAEGPMQFLPATWASYGSGNVHNPRDAILGAARYLVANGAPGDMAGALYRYNPSVDYVDAVEAYAARMRADPRAYYGYYYWRVTFRKLGGLVLLPVGYPRARPVALRALLGGWALSEAST